MGEVEGGAGVEGKAAESVDDGAVAHAVGDEVEALDAAVPGEQGEEALEVRGGPGDVGFVFEVVVAVAVRGPAVEDRGAGEVEVEGHLSGAAGGGVEGDVVAVDEEKGVAGWGGGDAGADASEEGLLVEGEGVIEDDVFFGVFADFEAEDGRAFEAAGAMELGDGDAALAEVEGAGVGAEGAEEGTVAGGGQGIAVGGEEDGDLGGVGWRWGGGGAHDFG